jgi:hypothetical protein
VKSDHPYLYQLNRRGYPCLTGDILGLFSINLSINAFFLLPSFFGIVFFVSSIDRCSESLSHSWKECSFAEKSKGAPIANFSSIGFL